MARPSHPAADCLDDLAAVPLERIESEITELAGHINAATCRWLCLVAELDRREGWATWGAKSCAHWLSWRCSVTPNAAREQVRVARRLSELPAVRGAFASGELSFSKVRALTRVATEDNEEELVGIARHATAAQLEVMVRSYRRAVRVQELELRTRATQRAPWFTITMTTASSSSRRASTRRRERWCSPRSLPRQRA